MISAVISCLIVIGTVPCFMRDNNTQPITVNIVKAKPEVKTKPERAKTDYRLIIPTIHLNETIYQGINKQTLQKGIGQANNMQLNKTGNIVLAGHNWIYGKADFTKLKNIELNDIAIIKQDNHKYYYQAYLRKIVQATKKNANYYLRSNSKTHILTMYTCLDNNDSDYRLIVQFKQIHRDATNEKTNK